MAAEYQEMQDAQVARELAASLDKAASSSSSSSSQLDESSLFPLFRAAKKRAVATSSVLPVSAAAASSVLSESSSSSSSSSASSGSASSAHAAAQIEWIDPSADEKSILHAAVWKLGVFLCSKSKDKDTGTYKVKCKFCEYIADYHGTTNMEYHAEHKHPTLPAVVDWLKTKNAALEVKNAQSLSSRQSLIKVCLLLHIHFCAAFTTDYACDCCRSKKRLVLTTIFVVFLQRWLVLQLKDLSLNGFIVLLNQHTLLTRCLTGSLKTVITYQQWQETELFNFWQKLSLVLNLLVAKLLSRLVSFALSYRCNIFLSSYFRYFVCFISLLH